MEFVQHVATKRSMKRGTAVHESIKKFFYDHTFSAPVDELRERTDNFRLLKFQLKVPQPNIPTRSFLLSSLK